MQHPEEGPISKEELQQYYKPIDYSVFCDAASRLIAQSDISQELRRTIEYLTPDEIFINTIKTLEFKKYIQSSIARITTTIDAIKHIKDLTPGQYGLQLDLRIPKLEERLKNLENRIDTNYQQSNTHIQLSNREKELIQKERIDIKNEMLKFQEDLSEYI